MRAAIYARVSTNDQDEAMQLTELREYCRRKGWDAVEFVDHGVSGRKGRRPMLDELWRSVRHGSVDVVVVWRFDRFGRSVKQLILALEEFRELGVQFVSLREAIDTTTPMGQTMFTIIAAFSELESNIIRDRVKAGLAEAKRRGTRLGRPRLIERTQRRRICEMHSQGRTYRTIADTMGVGLATVARIIKEDIA